MSARDIHPGERALAAFAAGEPAPAVADHVEDCARCRLRVDQVERDRARLLARLPPARFLAAVAARRGAPRVRWRRHVVSAILVAAVATAWCVVPRRPSAPLDGVRLKGTSVNVFRKRGALVSPLGDGDQLRAGDGLRVTITVGQPTRATVWFEDARGRVDRYPGAEDVALVAGETALPGAVVVDAPCVDLRLVVRIADTVLERALPCE